MQNGMRRLITLLAVISLFAGGNAMADTVSVAKGSKLWLEGDSTLHRYKADATKFRADIGVNPAGGAADLEALVRAGGVKSLTLEIPVDQLRSGKDDLDKNIVKTLNGSDHPTITFRMDSYQVLPASGPDALALKLRGKLRIAGVEKAVDLDAKAVKTASGLQLTGSKQLLMSDYSVKAPVLMMGMLKTKDEVVVKFDLQLQSE